MIQAKSAVTAMAKAAMANLMTVIIISQIAVALPAKIKSPAKVWNLAGLGLPLSLEVFDATIRAANGSK